MKPIRKDARLVSRADHLAIQKRLNLQGDEDYVVTVSKGKGTWHKTVHVFLRAASLPEIERYEQTASRVKFKGQKAEMEGSQILAAAGLYDSLISRAYDIPRGVTVIEQMNRDEAKKLVNPLMKREAIREFVAEVYSATRMAEAVGGDDESDADDDNPEDHTSATQPGSDDPSEDS